MARALSVNLRERVVRAVLAGASCRSAAARFGVSTASAVRWCARLSETGSVAPGSLGGDRRSGRIEAQAALILCAVERTPDITLAELRQALAMSGVIAGLATLWRFLERHGLTRKRRMARPVGKGEVVRRAGLHQRIRSQGRNPGQDGVRPSRA